MDTRIDNDVEATTEEQRIETPAPEWLEAGFEKLFPPPGENTEPGFIVRSLWTAHQSVPQVLVRLPLALVQSIYFHAIEAFYWKTALLQACIMFIFFADMLTPGMLLVMGLTYAFLLLRDGYYKPEDMFEWNIFLLFLAPELLLAFSLFFRWLLPGWDVPPGIEIWQRCLLIGVLIYICRGLYFRSTAGKAGSGHPYKDVIDAHADTWLFSCGWFAGWTAYLVTSNQLTTPESLLQPWLTVTPAMMLFFTSLRLQLNPIGGNHRKPEIDGTLFTDHVEKELVTKRDYLLVGTDWLSRPTLKSVLEMGGFFMAATPVLVSLIRWHMRSPIGIDWLQLTGHAIAYVGLTAVWHYVKRVHRRTQTLFDKAIAQHRARKAMGIGA